MIKIFQAYLILLFSALYRLNITYEAEKNVTCSLNCVYQPPAYVISPLAFGWSYVTNSSQSQDPAHKISFDVHVLTALGFPYSVLCFPTCAYLQLETMNTELWSPRWEKPESLSHFWRRAIQECCLIHIRVPHKIKLYCLKSLILP